MYSKNTGRDLTTMSIDPITGLSDEEVLKLPKIKMNGTPTRFEAGLAFEPYGGIKNIDEEATPQGLIDIPEERAQNQSTMGLIGKGIGQFATEAILGMPEAVGYALDFEEIYNADKQSREGFNNWFSEGFSKAKEYVQDELFPIYQTNAAKDGDFFDKISDGTWLASQGKTFGTTVALMAPSFAIGAISQGAGSPLVGAMAAAMFSRKSESAMEANGTFKQEYARYIQEGKSDSDARRLAGESAAIDFKANAAMLPLDFIQYATLFKPLAGFAKTLNAAKATAIGRGAGIATNVLGEGFEEGYQNVAQNEAIKHVREGVDPFGNGFGERLGEYIKDPEFQTSAFMGMVTGGVFDSLGHVLNKIKEKVEINSVGKTIAANLKDKDAFDKIDNKIEADLIVRALKTNQIDKLRTGISSLASDIDSKEDLDNDYKSEVKQKASKMIENIDYIQKADEEIKLAKPEYALNHNVRSQYILAKYEDKKVSERINELESKLNSELSGYTNFKDRAVIDASKVRGATKALDQLNKDEKLDPQTKKERVAALQNELTTHTTSMNSNIAMAKEIDPSFDLNKYSLPNTDKINELQHQLTVSKIVRDIKRKQLAEFENKSPEELAKEDAKINETAKENLIATQKESLEREVASISDEVQLNEFNTKVDKVGISDKEKSKLKDNAKRTFESNRTNLRREEENAAREQYDATQDYEIEEANIGEPSVGEREFAPIDEENIPEENIPKGSIERDTDFINRQLGRTPVAPIAPIQQVTEPIAPIVSPETKTFNDATETDESIPLTANQEKEAELKLLESEKEVNKELVFDNVAAEVSVARKDKVGTKENGINTDTLDENGNIQITEGTNTQIFEPEYLLAGTELTLQIDTESSEYTEGMDINEVPIKVINSIDGKFVGYVHTISWLMDKKFKNEITKQELIDKHKKIREFFLSNGNVDLNKTGSTKVIDKTPGWLNLGRKARTMEEAFSSQDGAWDERVQLKALNNKQSDVDFIGVANNKMRTVLKGMIVAIIPASNGQNLIKVMKQYRLNSKKRKNAKKTDSANHDSARTEVRDEFVHNIVGILAHSVTNLTMNKAALVEEVSKYIYAQDKNSSEVGKYLGGSENRLDLLFNIDLFDTGFIRNVIVSIKDVDTGKGYNSYKLEVVEGKVTITKRIRGIEDKNAYDSNNPIQYSKFEDILKTALSEKYLNVVDSGLNEPIKFSRLVADKNYAISEVAEDYRNFLSEKGILTTTVHGITTDNGYVTYITQPNIVYSENLNELKPEVKITEEVATETVVSKPARKSRFKFAGDPEIVTEIQSLKVDLNLDKTSISSFSLLSNVNQENDIVNSLVVQYLDIYQELTKPESKDKDSRDADSMDEILEGLREFNEDAKAGVLSSNKIVNDQIEKYTQLVIDNFETSYNEDGSIKFIGYKTRIQLEIDKLKFDSLESIDEDKDSDEEVGEAQFIDNKNFKSDPEKSASGRIKRNLAFLPKYEGGKIKTNILGMEVYRDYYETFNTVMEATADIDINEIRAELADLGAILSKRGETNNVYDQVVEMLDNSPKEDSFYNEFMSVFKKQRAKFLKMIIFSKKDGYPGMRVYLSNKSGAAGVMLNKWKEAYRNSAIINQITAESSDKKSPEYNKLKNKFNALLTESDVDLYIKGLSETFNSIGISISEEALTKIYSTFLKNPKRLSGLEGANITQSKGRKILPTFIRFKDVIHSNFVHVIESTNKFEDIAEEDDGLRNDIFKTEGIKIGILAKYEGAINPTALSSSYRNAAGDTIYGFINPHSMSNRVNDLKNDEKLIVELASDPFAKHSTWMNSTNTKSGEVAIKDVELFYLDSSVNGDSKSKDAVPFEEMSDIEKEQTKAGFVLNGGNKIGYFLTPTPSDKTTFPFTSAEKIEITREDIDALNGNFNPSEELKSSLYDLFVQSEIDRINATIKLVKEAKEADDFSQLIKGEHYDIRGGKLVLGSKGYFFLLPQMNEAFKEKLNSALENGVLLADSTIGNDAMVAQIQTLINIKHDLWTKLDLFKRLDKNYMTGKFSPAVRNSSDVAINGTETLKNRYAAIDYTVNSMVAYANQLMLMVGDPATFSKPEKSWDGTHDTWNSMVDGSVTNMFKRTAKDIAPGYEGRFDDVDKEYTSIFINEPERSSELVSEYKDKLDATLLKGLNNIEFADAQEWTTLPEHVKVLAATGRISQAQKETILEKYKNNENLTDAELGLVLQPMKPVQVGSVQHINNRIEYYIKTSSFPLIPQLTNGLAIDMVRQFMEAHKIDRMVPKSAVKMGFHKNITITDKEGNLLIKDGKLAPVEFDELTEEEISSRAKTLTHVLDRSFFRIQQDVPYSETKKKILEGSQLKKLKYSDLIAEWKFSIDGVEYSGHELKDLDDKIHIEIYQRHYDELLESLDAKIVGDKIQIENFGKLKELLIDEAKARGFDFNDLMLLNATNNTINVGDIPLFMHPALPKIEALMNSLIKNKVLITKFPGKSYVQGSSMGFDSMIEATKENLLKLKKTNGIQFLNSFKGSLGYSMDNGFIEAEILLPWFFAENINDFIDKTTGEIDETKIDPKLLDLIGYRIPTQDHGSMVKLKVVGFLPKSSGDLIIVPPEMSKVMGSDFDVDKLYVHRYNYIYESTMLNKVNPSSTDVSKLSMEELQNLSLGITHSILENENITERLLSPLDNDDIDKVIKEIDEMTPTKGINFSKASQTSILFDGLHSQFVDINAAGKTGVGVGSVASTSHVLAQYAGLYLQSYLIGPADNKILINNAIRFSENKNDKSFNEETTDQSSTHGGRRYDSAVTDGLSRLDRIFGITIKGVKKRISQVIKNIQTEAVDNAKNQRLFGMNLNRSTFDVAFLLAKSGLDERYIGFFLNQPIIKEYTTRLNSIGDIGSTEFDLNKKQAIQEDLWKEFSTNSKSKRLVPDNYSSRNVSFEEMKNSLDGNNKENKFIGTEEFYDFQLNVFESFVIYSSMANKLSGVFRAINTDTKYLGKSLTESATKVEDFESDFSNDKLIGNKEYLFDTLQMEAYNLGIKGSLALYENLPPYSNGEKLFSVLRGMVKANAQKDKLNDTQLDEIFKAIKSAIWIKAFAKVSKINIDSYRKHLLFGSDTIAKQVNELKKTSKNTLITLLNTSTSDSEVVPDTVEFPSSGAIEKDFSLKMQQSWMELYNNPETQAIAVELMGYAMLNGNQRNARDFSRFIPFDMMKDLGLLKEVNSSYKELIDRMEDPDQVNALAKQFYQHNPQRAYAGIDKDFVIEGDVIYPKKKLNLPEAVTFIYLYDKKAFKQNLYMKDGRGFVRINTLGNRKSLLVEYDIENSNKDSIFASNNVVKSKASDQVQNKTNEMPSFYEGDIVLSENTIFVFGSNPEGRHGAGAAKVAVNKFGAKYGQGEGLQGSAYALPTKDLRVKENNGLRSISQEDIIENIKKLYQVAKENPSKQFKIAFRNTTESSLNGYTGIEMIEMFNAAGYGEELDGSGEAYDFIEIPSNIIFSKEWVETGLLHSTGQTQQSEQSEIMSEKSNYDEGKSQNVLFAISESSGIVNRGLIELAKILNANHSNLLNTVELSKGSLPVGEFGRLETTGGKSRIIIDFGKIRDVTIDSDLHKVHGFPVMSKDEFFAFIFLHESLHKITNTYGSNNAELNGLFSKFTKDYKGTEFAKYTENVGEFISGIFTDKGFQEYLNGVKLSGNKSILDKILDIIKSLVVGIEVNTGSLLDASMAEALKFISPNVNEVNEVEDNQYSEIEKSLRDKINDRISTDPSLAEKFKITEEMLNRMDIVELGELLKKICKS